MCDKPFQSCLDEDEWSDLRREVALTWHERNQRCPECRQVGFHLRGCPEAKDHEQTNC